MKKLLASLALALLIAVPVSADLKDYLPPDNTPVGWSRDGEAVSYSSANLGSNVSESGAFTSNGLQDAVVQFYRKGGKEVVAEIYDLGSRDNAEAAFNALAAGKPMDIDLGEGSVIEENQIFFYLKNFVVRVKTESPDEETMQTMATIGQTIWFSLE